MANYLRFELFDLPNMGNSETSEKTLVICKLLNMSGTLELLKVNVLMVESLTIPGTGNHH